MPPVEPKLLRGFRDLLPAEMLFRDRVISSIKEVYELYGYSPLSTPALEYREVLLGYGAEASKQIYLFQEPEGNEVGLRFDLTVPLSRVVARYRDLPRPFKRYQIQPVWRYDKPDPGRFREFIQFDIDVVGSDSMLVDAEIISTIYESLTRVGLRAKVRFSDRKILNNLLSYAGIPDGSARDVFRVIDKLDKLGLDNVKMELGPGRTDESGAEISGLGLTPRQIEKIETFVQLTRPSRAETLAELSELFGDVQGAQEGIDELRSIDEFLNSMGVTSQQAAVDLSIARGLDYYTGPVYEAVILDERVAGIGSVMGGGRYDDLIGQFTGSPVPATGASIGVDRLVAAVQKLGEIDSRSSTADVLVTVMDKDRLVQYVQIAKELRDAGINTELYSGTERSIGKQLKYADRQAIPVAIIAGSNEFNAGEVSVKDLTRIRRQKTDIKDRQEWIDKKIGQKTIPLSDLVSEVGNILGRGEPD